jgi:hypothetical protein
MITNEVEEARGKKEQVLPYCPEKPRKKRPIYIISHKISILLIVGILISGIAFATTIESVLPVANETGAALTFYEWSKTINYGSDGTVLLNMLETSDGGILVTGFYNGLFFSKFDIHGIEQWSKHLDGGEFDPHIKENDFYYFNSQNVDFHIFETSNGGFLMGWGFSQSPTHFTIIVRADQDGNFLWSKLLTGPFTTDMLLTDDDGLVIIGGSNGRWWWVTKPWRVLKLDQDGYVEWNNTDDSTNETLMAVLEAPNGGYLTLGQLDDKRIVHKLDRHGNVEWNKTYGGWVKTEYDYLVNSPSFAPIHTVDDGYIIHGRYRDLKIGTDGKGTKVTKINLQGDLIWSQMLSFSDYGFDVVDFSFKTVDGGLMMVISTNWFYDGAPLASTIVKLKSTGNLEWRNKGEGRNTGEVTPTIGSSSVIHQVTPEKYLLSQNTDANNNQLLLIHINGTILWSQSLNSTKSSQIKGFISTTDGGVVLAEFINDGTWHEPWWVGFEAIRITKINSTLLDLEFNGHHEWKYPDNTVIMPMKSPILFLTTLIISIALPLFVINKLRHFEVR